MEAKAEVDGGDGRGQVTLLLFSDVGLIDRWPPFHIEHLVGAKIVRHNSSSHFVYMHICVYPTIAFQIKHRPFSHALLPDGTIKMLSKSSCIL